MHFNKYISQITTDTISNIFKDEQSVQSSNKLMILGFALSFNRISTNVKHHSKCCSLYSYLLDHVQL